MRETLASETVESLVERVEFYREDASRQLDEDRQSELGQFLTPASVSQYMASLFGELPADIRLLEPGAGVGSLIAGFMDEITRREKRPDSLSVVAYEIDPLLNDYLLDTLRLVDARCSELGIKFSWTHRDADFIAETSAEYQGTLFAGGKGWNYNAVLMNPPYGKINRDSEPRQQLRQIGLEASNVYTGFLGAASARIADEGQMVAITPRSFCNGPYFKKFREFFLERMAFKHIHTFESRNEAFQGDEVLQENIIFRAVRGAPRKKVTITANRGPEAPDLKERRIKHEQLIWPDDPNLFLHIVPDESGQKVADAMSTLGSHLPDQGLTVSTGPVVGFRAKEHLRALPGQETVPLLYPTHVSRGNIRWPKEGAKANALAENKKTRDQILPDGNYVLIRRFTAKEEDRRLVAAVHQKGQLGDQAADGVGLENHLNYIHEDGRSLPLDLARGIAAFLNSSLADQFFRQFSGHTQVNATDLEALPVPPRETLRKLGGQVEDSLLDPKSLDLLVEEIALPDNSNPTNPNRRLEEAQEVLRAVEVPSAQQNQRSALTLLALLGLRPGESWSQAKEPLMGIHDMLQFFEEHYGVSYAENTRETVRRDTVHQFIEAGIVRKNPDDPSRPTNSPNTVYQIAPNVLELVRTFNTDEWDGTLEAYLDSTVTLEERHARRRDIKLIPVEIPGGETIKLSPGEHHELVRQVVEEFGPRFTPGGTLLYVGDTADKFAYCEQEMLEDLGMNVAGPDKMPDVVIHHGEEDWLVLVEAVTSHGPVNPTRRSQLEDLCAETRPGLVYVTAFPDRKRMVAHLNAISWETEVWVADAPDHLIHFDGTRFLGPYDD